MENGTYPNTTLFGTNSTPLGTNSESLDRPVVIFMTVFYGFIIVVGAPGNCLILRVYWSKSHKYSTHILIMGLALADLVVCVFRLWDIILNSSKLAGVRIRDLTDLFNCFDFTTVGVSIMITAVIALDRYDCVCRSNRRALTYKRAKKALVVSVTIAVSANVPFYIEAALKGRAPNYLETVRYALQIGLFVVPIVTIFLCYGFVFLKIRKHVKVREGSKARGERRTGHIEWSTRSHASIFVPSVSREVGIAKVFMSQGHQMTIKNKTEHSETTKEFHGPNLLKINCPRQNQHDMPLPEIPPSIQPPRTIPDLARKHDASPALQRRTTVMLFVTSVAFVVCWLPYWIKALLEIFGKSSYFLNAFMEVLYLNNAINPFIYGIANRRFRRDCKDVFRKLT